MQGSRICLFKYVINLNLGLEKNSKHLTEGCERQEHERHLADVKHCQPTNLSLHKFTSCQLSKFLQLKMRSCSFESFPETKEKIESQSGPIAYILGFPPNLRLMRWNQDSNCAHTALEN